jgi:hypothetical protein
MWILFGTNYNTVENEPCVYFIGIFDNFELVNEERNKLIIQYKTNKYDYFIKDVKMNENYDYSWSNCDDL